MSFFNLFKNKMFACSASALTISALLIQPASAQLHRAKTQPAAAKGVAQVIVIDGIDFGDDTSQWANDGECDDPRFVGNGTAVDMEDVDLSHDATDCSTLYQAGAVTLKPKPADIVSDIDFGDNSSQWADDGQCDDPRFGGEGVDDLLLDEDMAHDANDCKSLFLAGTIQYLGDDPNMQTVQFDGIDFGDNTSQWNSDGECDDPRFSGTGMAQQLVEADLAHDAQDCLALYQDGSITLNTNSQPVIQSGSIDFGDDSSEWSNDGECDDPRFAGEGVAGLLLEADLGHDATDCSTLLEAGKIYLAGNSNNAPDAGQVDFGDDTSQWSNDGECDDPRFSGAGVAETLLEIDRGHDASDCRSLFQAGAIQLAGGSSSVAPETGQLNFGDNSSQWSNDGECDDPRFIGEGMASQLLAQDIARDATDCQTLFDAGNIAIINASNLDFGDDASRWPNDGECDDPRFAGEGSSVKPDPRDFGHDATDCQALLASGSIEFIGGFLTLTTPDNLPAVDVTPASQNPATQIDTSINWGDNTSEWANDGECDDPRFAGEGVADILLEEDQGHDATDCQTLFDAGQINLITNSNISRFHNGGFQFGDNTSEYANNEICDDPRFTGPGADPILLPEDEGRDANDCKTLFRAGQVSLLANMLMSFGDDNLATANDGRCDDPRFAGKAMGQTTLDAGANHDASDCRAAFMRGKIYNIEDGRINFGDNTSEWADDNECDDPRFSGPGSAESASDDDLMKDAIDCRTLYRNGEIFLLPQDGSQLPIAFGDDNNQWANDGECDDPRFSGQGMAAELLDEDMGHDASDCQMLLNNGQIQFGSTPQFEAKNKGADGSDTTLFDYGDDTSTWSNDGECDDPRFAGNGMADILLDEDIAHDATDCRALVEAGQISVIDGAPSDTGNNASNIDFGDNASFFADDGECDDDRFTGPGMAQPPLTQEHRGHDANDCQAAINAGTIALLSSTMESLPNDETATMEQSDPAVSISQDGIIFGDNLSIFARDTECDDPRFTGPGTVAGSSNEHVRHDADDCLAAYNAGATFGDTPADPAPVENPPATNDNRIVHSGIDFGDDNGDWANDGTCDDPRFAGPGVADLLLPADETHDASDCSALFLDGQVRLAGQDSSQVTTEETSEANPANTVLDLDFGDNDSLFAEDSECDDPRFTGAGMAPAPLFEGHRGHDANDCEALFNDGKISLAQ